MALLILYSETLKAPTTLLDYFPHIIALLAVIFSFYQFIENIRLKKNEQRRNEIYQKLNSFYGPYLYLRKKSDILYDKFQRKYREEDPNFSTLKYLLNGHEFSSSENILLQEIIDIGKISEKLIQDNSGLIDDDYLMNNLIPKASTHYLILRLAYKGVLDPNFSHYEDLTFPIDIDHAVTKRKNELENELKQLNRFKLFHL